jgi:imidazoleglycerol-phosphate dehydratase
VGGRPYLVLDIACKRKKILDFDLGLFREFFLGFVVQARMNLHIRQFYGDEPHHAWECVFKALARALRMACTLDAQVKGIPSSKGIL